MTSRIIFIHGLNSSGQGVKGRFFSELNTNILTPDFIGTVEERIEHLETILAESNNWTLIGSSLGGLIAAITAGRHPEKVNRLILLAPALRMQEYRTGCFRTVSCPVTIFHGVTDDVIPLSESRTVAEKIFLDLEFYEVEDDHSLHATLHSIDWQNVIGTDPDEYGSGRQDV